MTAQQQPDNEQLTPQEESRRRFLNRSILAIGTFVGVSLGVPIGGYLVSPALQKQVDSWVRLGRTSQVEANVPTLFTITIDRSAGWVTAQLEESYYVITEDGENFTVLSNVCTHLGCRVHWSEDDAAFLCPCHGAVFDIQGNVVEGPPPRPLTQATFQIDADGNLLIQEVG